jgi:hypothetical protein
MVSSVTFAPSREQDPAERAAAIRRFLQRRDVYKKRRIWAGVSPVLTPAELEICFAMKAPVVGGPAVAELAPQPVGARMIGAQALPFKA